MATFGDIQTRVSKRLLDANNTAVELPEVSTAINDAIRTYKRKKFWFNIVEDVVQVTLQSAILPVTGDVLAPSKADGAFTIQYSNMRYNLMKITENQFNNWYLDNGYGIPRYYARVGQQYLMYPLPDRAYDIRRSYYKDYDDLVNPNETNDFTDEADRLIILEACANLIAELRQDDKMEAYFRAAAKNEYNELNSFTNKLNGTNRLTIHSNLL